jgi:hypothetical protein
MRLLNLPIRRNLETTTSRRARAFRPVLDSSLEGLEQRAMLSGAGVALVAPVTTLSPLTITSATVTHLTITGANTLAGTLNLATALHTPFGSTPLPKLQVPFTMTATTSAPVGTSITPAVAGTSILHLSLQIPDLDLLGLHVRLDNCNGGPVTVDINAIPSGQPGGGVLGSLLTSVDNLLTGTGGLLNLSSTQASGVTGALTTVLNGLLKDLTAGGIVSQANGGTGGTMGTSTGVTDTIPAGDTELVDLHLGPINADILGLQITTSQICLNLYADPTGGLLGSLLSGLDNLLNNGIA